MFHFYFHEHTFLISSNPQHLDANHYYVLGNANAQMVLSYMEKTRQGEVQGIAKFAFVVHSLENTLSQLKQELKQIKAAGGLVKRKDQYVVLRRLNKWDLPKGKVEKGEQLKEAALREVEEECGIRAQVKGEPFSTWHAYDLKNKTVLKETIWYRMITKDKVLVPQTEEDITDILWVTKDELVSKISEDSYATIEEVIEHFTDW